MLVPLMGGALIGNLPLIGFPAIHPEVEGWYLKGYFVFALVAYTKWALVVIEKICVFLDINCLTIKSKKTGLTKVEMLHQEVQNGGDTEVRATRKDRLA